MSAESLQIIFLGVQKFDFLSRPTFIVTAIAALVGVGGALVYFYRLLVVTREMKGRFGILEKPVDTRRVYGGVFYFNRFDSALFVRKYGFNFANVWSWVFIACIIAYPLLVFLPGSE